MGIIRNLIVLRDTSKQQAKDSSDLLRLMVCNEPFGSFVLDCLNDTAGFCKNRGMIAIPQDWAVPDIKGRSNVVRYTETVPICFKHKGFVRETSWVVVSNGRFLTAVDNQRICKMLADSQADVIAINIVAQLRASYEKVLTTSQNELVGFRLFYEDAAQPTPAPR